MTPAFNAFVLATLAPLFAGTTLWIVPKFRRTLFFGVRIAADWSLAPETRRVARVYQSQIAVWTLLDVALSFIGIRWNNVSAIVAGNLALAVGGTIAYFLANRAARPFASGTPVLRTASLSPSPETLPGGVAALLTPFAVLGLAAIWLATHWDAIPLRFPVHFDIAGQPNGWAHRTWKGVFGSLIQGASVMATLLGVAVGIVRSSPRGSEWSGRFRRATLRFLIGMLWAMSLLFSWIALNPILGFQMPPILLTVLILGAVGALAFPLLRLGSDPDSGTDATPDSAWKMGIIYYNPEDPALMVEKRFGLGYTVNFANRTSWVLMALTLAVPVVALVIIRGA